MRQHYLAQWYQRIWSQDARRKKVKIWLLKERRLVRNAKILTHAQKEDWYDTDGRLEKGVIHSLDTEGADGHRKVIEWLDNSHRKPTKLDPEAVADLTAWVMAGWQRGVQRADDVESIANQILEPMVNGLAQQLGAEEMDADIRRIWEQTAWKAEVKERFARGVALSAGLKSADELTGLILRFVEDPEERLVTSDCPVVATNGLVDKGRRTFILAEGFMLYCPLTPRYGILWQDPKVYQGEDTTVTRAGKKSRGSLNRMVVDYAQNTVILPRGDDGEWIRERRSKKGGSANTVQIYPDRDGTAIYAATPEEIAHDNAYAKQHLTKHGRRRRKALENKAQLRFRRPPLKPQRIHEVRFPVRTVKKT